MAGIVEYKEMCTIKPIKQLPIEEKIEKENTLENALNYLDTQIEWCTSLLSEKYMNMNKDMDDKEFLEEKENAQVWLEHLNLCLDIEQKLKGRI